MKKAILCLLTVMLLLAGVFNINVLAGDDDEEDDVDIDVINSGKYENAYRYNIQGWIYLHIEGEPYDRGYQHGYLLAAEIVDHIQRWSNVIHNSKMLDTKYYDQDSEKYEKVSKTWWNFCRNNIERIYWDRTPEEYQEEMKGIADGVKDRGGRVFDRWVDYIDILTINQFFEWMTRNENLKKKFHPFKDLFNSLKSLVPMSLGDEDGFLDSFLSQPPTDHCNAFIATGDATTDGQIVAAHDIRCGGWWYSYYIAQRWNVILDITPSDGYRLMLHSSPGFIWSDANYYQNEEGIVIMDTTCPQGLWRDKGYSMAIRTRRAAQYSENLDDAIDYLMEQNDGMWTAAYLIGDSETGEIARLDLSLYNYEIWRTFDGFYWSANNIMSKKIRAEANGLGLKGVLFKLIGLPYYAYFTRAYNHADRDAKLVEMGEKYYGEIDIEVLKNKIMTVFPIVDSSTTDLKATDSQLMENNSLWAFWGNALGMTWDISDVELNLKGGKNVPPAGWTFISGIPEGHDVEPPESMTDLSKARDSEIIWDYDVSRNFEGINMWYSNMAFSNDTVFSAGLDGKVYAFNPESGRKLWKEEINNYGGNTWITAEDEYLAIGWENETSMLDAKTGNIIWENDEIEKVSSAPVFIDEHVIFGTRNGEIYAADIDTGDIIWDTKLDNYDTYLAVDKKHGRVIATNYQNVYSIDADNGDIKWTLNTDGTIVSQPLVFGDTVYVGSCDTNLYCLNARNGEMKWKYSTGWSIITTPTYSNGVVYTASADHRLYSINAKNAELLWSFQGNAAIHSNPVAYGKCVFFGCDDGRYYAVNKSDGNLSWYYAPAETIDDDIHNYVTTAIVGNSIVNDGKVYTSMNGLVYCFDAQTSAIKVAGKDSIMKIETFELMFIILVIILIILLAIIIRVAKKKK